MSNTITIKDPNGNIVCSVENVDASRSEENSMVMYASSLKYKNQTEYLSSDKFKQKLIKTATSIKKSGATILNSDTIKTVKRSFGTALKEFLFDGKQIKESDLFNSVKWIKVEGIDVCVVTNVQEIGTFATKTYSYKDYYIWYTKDNKTCKAKRIGGLQMKGTNW